MTRINTGFFLSGAQKENSVAIQLIASIPDRVRPGALSELRSPYPDSYSSTLGIVVKPKSIEWTILTDILVVSHFNKLWLLDFLHRFSSHASYKHFKGNFVLSHRCLNFVIAAVMHWCSVFPLTVLLRHFHLSSVCDCLEAIEEYWTSNLGSDNINKAPFLQAGELFSRFCRRGHAGKCHILVYCNILCT
jgi:hypothetical protein